MKINVKEFIQKNKIKYFDQNNNPISLNDWVIYSERDGDDYNYADSLCRVSKKEDGQLFLLTKITNIKGEYCEYTYQRQYDTKDEPELTICSDMKIENDTLFVKVDNIVKTTIASNEPIQLIDFMEKTLPLNGQYT